MQCSLPTNPLPVIFHRIWMNLNIHSQKTCYVVEQVMHGREVQEAACEKSQFFLGNSVAAFQLPEQNYAS